MPLDWRTKLAHPDASAPAGFRSLATPVCRGSTTLFDSAAHVHDHWDRRETPYTYGLYGTPTTLELAARIAELEGGGHCFIAPGGQAAISLVNIAVLKAGGHVLIPDCIYGPHREFADRWLSRWNIRAEYYDPLAGAGVAALLRPETQLVWCESPGSATMEVQDVPAIAAAAHAAGVPVALDNTYAAGVLFDAFGYGADIAVQALTKYIGGHSDLLLGSVTVRDEALYQAIGDAHQLLGMGASPDDCSLALRGLQTLGVRLDHLQRSTLEVAQWLQAQPRVMRVRHPALPGSPGHEIWKRDFTGSASVFSVEFDPALSQDALVAFIDRLRLFKIGYSWGGTTSLVVPQFSLHRDLPRAGRNLVRFNIGLERSQDLIDDLRASLAQLPA
ncbi:cystathionine beta-lyase [Lysobacter enzymogenes]|uniref:cystathionine beta-lyase n=1 Tax=Lysobacter enzymogenes TaxID=69 RepID=UPI00384D135B